MKNVLEEKLLLYKVQAKKDPDAFACLYDGYVEPIYRFVYFKLSHTQEAEDVTGEIFLKCWQYLIGNQGREVKHFSGFLYTIARHQIIEVYRDRAKRQERALDSAEDVGDFGLAKRALEGKQEAERLMRLIQKLKQEYQEVLLFRYVEEFSVAEIAGITGKSKINVRVTLHRALKKLKEFSDDVVV